MSISNDLPYIQSAENTFYSASGPAYLGHPVGFAGANSDGKDADTTTKPSAKFLPKRFKLNRSYLIFTDGILRVALIIILIAALIAAALIAKSETELSRIFPAYDSSRTAFLVFVVADLIICALMFLMNFLNILNWKLIEKLPWSIIFMAIDLFFTLTMFSVSVTAAVRESQLNSSGNLINLIINKGAFAAAAFFGFVSVILHVAFVVFEFLRFKSKRHHRGATTSASTSHAPSSSEVI